MIAHYDSEAKALYVYCRKDMRDLVVINTIQVSKGMMVDVGEDGEVFGYEFLLDDELIQLNPTGEDKE